MRKSEGHSCNHCHAKTYRHTDIPDKAVEKGKARWPKQGIRPVQGGPTHTRSGQSPHNAEKAHGARPMARLSATLRPGQALDKANPKQAADLSTTQGPRTVRPETQT